MTEFDRLNERLTRRIAKIDAASLLVSAAQKLREVEEDPALMVKGWAPWELLLVMRRVVEHGRVNSRAFHGAAALPGLLNLVKRMPLEDTVAREQGLYPFFRRTAHQQFWCQREMDKPTLGRIWRWFGDPARLPHFHNAARSKLGIGLDEYLLLCLLLRMQVHAHPENLVITTENLFNNTVVDAGTQESFWGVCSADHAELNSFLETRRGCVNSEFLQQFGRTPFVVKPVFRDGGDFMPISQRLVEHHMMWFPFWLASEVGHADGEFAKSIESHVGELLEWFGLSFMAERDLAASQAADDGKRPDFAVALDDRFLHIEVKTFSMTGIAGVFSEPKVLLRALRSNIGKGVVQIMESEYRARTLGAGQGFGFVVTPWPLDLGPFPGLWDYCLKDHVRDELARAGIDEIPIEPSRIWMVSMRELEDLFLWQQENGQEGGLLRLLEDAALAERSFPTQMHQFGMHIPECEGSRIWPTAEVAVQDMLARGQALFKDASLLPEVR